MIKLKKQTIDAINNGELSLKDAAVEIASTYSTIEIAQAFIELATVQPEDVEKIVITEEQFKAYFKIRGVNMLTGQPELRGRKRKDDKILNG